MLFSWGACVPAIIFSITTFTANLPQIVTCFTPCTPQTTGGTAKCFGSASAGSHGSGETIELYQGKHRHLGCSSTHLTALL